MTITTTQREAALRLADWLHASGVVNSEVKETIALLRELLAEPQVGDDVAWLWTHCKALGMKCKSLSGSRRDDIALYVVDLHDLRAEPHREVAGVEVLPYAPTYTEQQIADACMAAEVPDSKCESVLLALRPNVRIQPRR